MIVDTDARETTVLDSLPKIIRKIPRNCFEISAFRGFWSLFLDFAMATALMAIIVRLDNWYLALPFSLLLGTVFTGLFVIGHDAGHRSFSYSEKINNIVGHIAMGPVLWPFHVWRLSHDIHHRWTHHIEKDIAWRPLTFAQFSRLSPIKQKIYTLTRSKLFFIASTLFQFYFIKDAVEGQFFEQKDRTLVTKSLVFSAVTAIAYIGVSLFIAGGYGFIWLFLVPQLGFHFWLSTFTFFHHTNPQNQLLNDGDWTPERAQLTLTVHVNYPRLIDWLCHDISWHVPHHVCVGVPFYHLRQAHTALKSAYPQWVCEKNMSLKYVREVVSTCHLVNSRAPGGQAWVTIEQYDRQSRSAPEPAGA